MTEKDALAKAIACVGSISALADKLGIARQAVSKWRRVPAGRAYAIEKITKGAVKCHDLRPDLFPRSR